MGRDLCSEMSSVLGAKDLCPDVMEKLEGSVCIMQKTEKTKSHSR
jgi:hypothetical protein